jgi:molybdopterin synthase catalytic subunit/molybdopterin synthase sulfur carrier subunit
MAEVTVRLFSVLKERTGQSAIRLNITEPTTAGAVLDSAIAAFPALAPYRSVIRFALNRAYVGLEAEVRTSDEMALITPVSGG